MRPQGETRELTVALNEAELVEAGAELSDAVETADSYEEHIAERKASWRDSLKAMKEELTHLRKVASEAAEVVRTGKDRRDVACTWLYALAAGYAFLVRDDTGALVAHRKLKDEERQLELGEAPFREPTPEQLDEWLKTLPVNEAETLPEGHAGEVTLEDRAVDVLLDPEADESFDRSHLQDASEFDRDLGYDYHDGDLDAIVTDEHGETLEEPISAGSTTPPLNPNPGISELAAMPDDQVARLARRK